MVGELNLPDKCIVCFYGEDCGCNGIDKLSTEEIENLLLIIQFIDDPFYMGACKCNAADIYKEYDKYLPHLAFIKKYNDKIKNLIKWQRETNCVEEFVINIHVDTIELFWVWEGDNGLYSTSGSMKALYHHEEEDRTWSKEETRSLIEHFMLDYESINTFEDFIRLVDIEKTLDEND